MTTSWRSCCAFCRRPTVRHRPGSLARHPGSQKWCGPPAVQSSAAIALEHRGDFTLGGIAAPAILQSDPERIAFNDNFVVDYEVEHTIPKVRRSMLVARAKDGQMFDALPFRMAVRYLEVKGIQQEAEPNDPKGVSAREGAVSCIPSQRLARMSALTQTGGRCCSTSNVRNLSLNTHSVMFSRGASRRKGSGTKSFS